VELKLTDISKCLDLPITTLNRWIRQGRIPVQKKGETAVFNEGALKKWAAQHHLCFSLEREGECRVSEVSPDSLLSAMQRGQVFYDVSGVDVGSVLKSGVEVIPGLSDETRRVLYRRLVDREELTSTGIGKGVAIPHPRSPVIKETDDAFITTCFLKTPAEFDAVDDKPVFVLFILMSPSVKIHLHLLSRLAFCVRHDAFVEFLAGRPKPDLLFAKIADFETRLDES